MANPNRASTSDSRKVKAQPGDDQKPQSDKFRDIARELECDEDEAAFEEKVKRIATMPKPRNPGPPDSAEE